MNTRSTEVFFKDIADLYREIQDLYLEDNRIWIIGYSGGKDSTAVLQLIWRSLAALPIEKRQKTIHVTTNDTLVENPLVSLWVRKSVERIGLAAKEQNMPFKAHLTTPEVKDSFWVNLIGRGYAAPTRSFRWCTTRLKIRPTDSLRIQLVKPGTQSILVLGVRKAESQNRRKSMEKRESHRVRARLNVDPDRPGVFSYYPIEDWETSEVWMYLMQVKNPWKHSNKELFRMYRGATDDNECPLVVDTSTPSCGSSRFGCWTCTVVKKDKSMSAMILNDEEKEWMEPLLELRNELAEPDHTRRDFRRMNGRVDLYEKKVKGGGTELAPIPGPYLKEWRHHWLRRLLSVQQEVRVKAPDEFKNIELITPDELSEIRRIWLEEKLEFEDSLPKIHAEITTETFVDPKRTYENLLGDEALEALEEVCGDDKVQFQLLSKVLGVEQKYKQCGHRRGVIKDLEKVLRTDSQTKEEAIAQAKELKQLNFFLD